MMTKMTNAEQLCKEYKDLTEEMQKKIYKVKDLGIELLNVFDTFTAKDDRELKLARARIEEGIMWATKHIVLNVDR